MECDIEQRCSLGKMGAQSLFEEEVLVVLKEDLHVRDWFNMRKQEWQEQVLGEWKHRSLLGTQRIFVELKCIS